MQCSLNSHQFEILKSNTHPILTSYNWLVCNSQFSPDQKPTLQFSPNSHLCSQYSCNSHQLEMAGANAHLMLIYNFHQIGENWLRIGWELSESWNSFLLGHAHRQQCCRCACQISEQYDNLCYQSCGFECMDTRMECAKFSHDRLSTF